ncbi:MAG: SagB family peptide dehydrogenase [Anaerolineales bacterium]|nr:MAG: SagB family peptide dehydrogenase [Anaerolineales bacterium]
MIRKDLDYLVIAAMLVSGLYLAITGLLMGLFASRQFFLHSYAGYASAALTGLHLALNWRRIMAYLRNRLGNRPGGELPTRKQPSPTLTGRRALLTSTGAAIGGFILGRVIPTRWSAGSPRGDMGTLYHQWSKPGYPMPLDAILDWGASPQTYKIYPEAEQIALPDPHDYQGLSLEEAIQKRRSIRDYAPQPLSLEELSRLLYAAQGITDQRRAFRAAPSAGALYPIETYTIVHDVVGLQPGLYHYAVADHALEQLQIKNLRKEIMIAGIAQEMLGQAQACFVLSAVFQRTRWKYRERAYRYVLLEAGHIGQNLYLAATSMGMGACAAGAFLDDELNKLLGLDGEDEAALYMLSVGKRK